MGGVQINTFVEIGNFQLTKTSEDSKTVKIRMIANRLEVDRENQQIVPQAFNKATVDEFLAHGIIDWHHQSVMARSQEERAAAILGRPVSFTWESNLPVVYGELTKAHPIVRDSILPHLEANQPVFGASVGGKVLKARRIVETGTGHVHEKVYKIDWNHIAIAASPYVMSPGSAVNMVKADHGTLVRYPDLTAFAFDDTPILKALQAGFGTDTANFTGLDALRVQSLEPGVATENSSPIAFHDELVREIMDGLRTNSVGGSKEGIRVFLRSKGYSEEEILGFMGRFLPAVQSIIGRI